MPILSKKEMTEEDIKLHYITPALIDKGWKDLVTMESKVQFTAGKINIQGNVEIREAPKKADYILYISANNPIAVVEAKDNNHAISFGLQQAMEYAQMMQIPFAYSSNGDGFYEHDFLTGAERQIGIDQFPTYQELVQRFELEANGGKGLTEQEKKCMNEPYCTGIEIYPPRYYQRIAINKTIDAIARGQNRVFLVMATGTGKTYTAFQICWRLIKSGTKKKILYLADRNILVDQSIGQDFKPFEKVIHKVNYSHDDPKETSSYQVFFSLYQQLADHDDHSEEDEENTVKKIQEMFSPTFFDLVIVDECHRGSAKANSSWRKILDYFSSAAQIGMTATPKETDDVSNIGYFGDPVYVYSMKQGIEDGFLAPFRVIAIKTDISDGWRPIAGQRDINGNVIEDRIYNNTDYDYNIVLEDRIYQVASEITEYLKATDRMQKTIVFCADEASALRMRDALANLNQDMVKENPDYVVRITGSDDYGKDKLKYFISTKPYPVIATTSKLLSTGVDCKMTKLIVLDQMIGSMTEFKQIIGRGTRIREDEGKMSFCIMDFRGVSRLFADPEWDGPIEMSEDYKPGLDPKKKRVPPLKGAKEDKPYVDIDGCPVTVINRVVSVYDTEGKLLRTQNIIDYTRANIIGEFASLEGFIANWDAMEKKEVIKNMLLSHGIDLEAMKKEQNMEGVDDFDFICHIVFDAKPLTRSERAKKVKTNGFFDKYSGVAKEVLERLLDLYSNNGIYDIESKEVLKLEPFHEFGTPSRIVGLFGGKDAYFAAIKAMENQIYGRMGA